MSRHNPYAAIEIVRLVKAGVTDNHRIAALTGLSCRRVCALRQRYGLANVRGPARWDARARELGFPDTAAAVRTWAAAGLTNGAMADRLGVWPAQLAPYLRGVTRPPGRGRVQREARPAAL